MTDTTEALRVAARSIALAGINGWGNLCNEATNARQPAAKNRATGKLELSRAAKRRRLE